MTFWRRFDTVAVAEGWFLSGPPCSDAHGRIDDPVPCPRRAGLRDGSRDQFPVLAGSGGLPVPGGSALLLPCWFTLPNFHVPLIPIEKGTDVSGCEAAVAAPLRPSRAFMWGRVGF